MLVYPKYGLKTGVSVPKFCVSFLIVAGGYLVQPAGFSAKEPAFLYFLVQRCWFIEKSRLF
ncbi:MAG: hypothetical protein CR997_14460 [Acidobacteria bacterium]|nr:MAG: hypothetical protein CR997_14460 [Acidobacteriota bacterium]